MFHQGGPMMYQIEYLGVIGLVLVGIHLFWGKRWSLWATAATIALVLVSGIYGTVDGRSRTDRGVELWAHDDERPTPPSELEKMRAQGYAEAMRPIQFAGIVTAVLVPLFAIAELRRRRRRTVTK